MKFLRYLLSTTFLVFLNSNAIKQDTVPRPKLSSADIEWWFPTDLPPKLHMTLRYFEIGDIWKNFSHKTLSEKREIRKEYPKIKAALIAAKNKLLNTIDFKNLFNDELSHNEAYSLKGIDIIGTHPDFYDHYALNTSSSNPSGILKRVTKFKELFRSGDPYGTQLIKTRKGKNIVPKYRWYLVAKLESNIIHFRNKLSLNPIFNQFPQNKTSYLPHITLGKIKNIYDVDKLIMTINNTNIRLSKESKERKSFQLKDIERFHPNEHKIYLLLDKARKSNMIFMLTIGWKTPLGKLLKNVVKLFPEQENTSSLNYINGKDTIFPIEIKTSG